MKMFSRVVVCAAALTLLAAAPAAAAKRVVDSDGQGSATNCAATNAAYFTITSAVAASSAGDQIIVCPGAGPYNEQVSVDKALTLTGKLGATVRPSPMVANSTSLVSGAPIAAAIVIEDGVSGAHIDQLTVDGSGNGLAGCAPTLIGVYYRNASGSVKNAVVKNFRLGAGLEGCQSGLGIYAQSAGAGASAVTVSNTSVHDFQKNGITGNESGTTLTATANFVTGDGPSPIIAQNGIQVGWGAKGVITSNLVSDLVYSPATVASAGILVFDAPPTTTVNANTVTTTQVGVYVETSSSITVNANVITQTRDYDGIYLSAGSDSNTVSSNVITHSDEAGIWIDGASNTVTKNKINEAPIGIVACAGNTVPTSGTLKNVFYNVPQPTAGCPAAPTAAAAAEGPAARVSIIR